MKKGKWVIVLALVLVVGLGTTAYAAAGALPQRLGLARITGVRGYDYVISVLKNKLGLTDEEINSARNSGKTMYDIALDKGLTSEELKTALYDERAKAVDEAVAKGTITKEQGETLKANLKLNIGSCTGDFGQGRGNGYCQGQCMGRGMGRGMMGNGQAGANCPFISGTN